MGVGVAEVAGDEGVAAAGVAVPPRVPAEQGPQVLKAQALKGSSTLLPTRVRATFEPTASWTPVRV